MWQLSYPRDEWPRYLWRVIHVNTQSVSYSWDPRELQINASAALDVSDMIPNDRYFGLDEFSILLDREANRHPAANNLFDFLDMMANHINWNNRSRTWFLSTFSHGRHAMNWAEQRHRWAEERSKNDDITVYKIDTTLLPPNARLFNMMALDELLRLEEQLDYQDAKDEVLIFGRIPEEAVVDVFQLWKNGYGSGTCHFFVPLLTAFIFCVTYILHFPGQGASSFFGGNVPGDNPGSILDEDMDERQVSIRAEVLAAENIYSDEWIFLHGDTGRTFVIPVTVARHCGYSEQPEEDESEEKEEVEEEEEEVEEEVQEVVVVVEQEDEEKEDEDAALEEVKEGVKGKDDEGGEPARKEDQDKGESEDEMAQLVSRLTIST